MNKKILPSTWTWAQRRNARTAERVFKEMQHWYFGTRERDEPLGEDYRKLCQNFFAFYEPLGKFVKSLEK